MSVQPAGLDRIPQVGKGDVFHIVEIHDAEVVSRQLGGPDPHIGGGALHGLPGQLLLQKGRISLDPLRHDVQILLCVRQERRAVCAARQQGVLEVGKDLVLLVQQLPAVCRQPLHGVGAARGPAVLHIVVERLVAQKGDEM